MLRDLSIVASLLVATVCGQEAREAPPAPRPLVTLEVAGPAALRQAFLATNLGNLIGGDEFKAVWSKLFLELAHVWYRSEGAHDEDTFTPFRKVFASYRGRVRVRLFALDSSLSDVQGVIEFLPDGRTDLGKLSKGLRQLIANATDGESKPRRVGDLSIDTLESVAGRLTLPFVHRKRVVMFLADDIEKTIRRTDKILAAEDPDPKARFTDGPIRLRIDIAKCYEAFDGFPPSEILTTELANSLFGVRDAKSLEIRIAPQGPHVRLDFTLEAKERFGMLFDVFFPKAKAPDVGRLPDIPRWSSLPISYAALWDVVTSFEAAESINEFLEFDVKGDLIDNLKPGFTMLGDDGSKCCWIFHVKDGEAVERSLYKILELDKRGEVTESEYRGVEIRTRPTSFDHDAHCALHKGRFLFAFGDAGRKKLEQAIDAQNEAQPSTPIPPPLFRTRTSRPPGCNGMGVIAAKNLHRALVTMLLDEVVRAIGKAIPGEFDVKRWKTQFKAIAPLFKKYKLEDLVWYSGRTDKKLYVRFVW